jgi:hypothetical protein
MLDKVAYGLPLNERCGHYQPAAAEWRQRQLVDPLENRHSQKEFK